MFTFGKALFNINELELIGPTQTDANSLFISGTSKSSSTIVDTLVSFVQLPGAVAGAVKSGFDLIFKLLFGYEDIFNAMALPLDIIFPIILVLRTIVIITVLATIADLISALRGGGFG